MAHTKAQLLAAQIARTNPELAASAMKLATDLLAAGVTVDASAALKLLEPAQALGQGASAADRLATAAAMEARLNQAMAGQFGAAPDRFESGHHGATATPAQREELKRRLAEVPPTPADASAEQRFVAARMREQIMDEVLHGSGAAQ